MYKRWDVASGEWKETPPEPERGCGFRQIGGLYLVGPPILNDCGRLLPLTTCPTCGHGFRQTRGWSWVEPYQIWDDVKNGEQGCRKQTCLFCSPLRGKHGLLWVGRGYYPQPNDFLREARELGISKKIRTVPRDFRTGETAVYIAHPLALPPQTPLFASNMPQNGPSAGIISAFFPHIEQIFKEGDEKSDKIKEAISRGICPVIVPDEPKHRKTKPCPRPENPPS